MLPQIAKPVLTSHTTILHTTRREFHEDYFKLELKTNFYILARGYQDATANTQGCRQNFQQTGIISSQAGLGESIIKDF